MTNGKPSGEVWGIIDNGLTSEQIEALKILKEEYTVAKEKGISIIDKKTCNALKDIKGINLNCDGHGLKANYEENSLKVHYAFTCYKVNFENDKIKNYSWNYNPYDSDNECGGYRLSVIEIDENDEWLIKIGGFDVVKNFIYDYIKKGDYRPLINQDNVSKRGGDKNKQYWFTLQQGLETIVKGGSNMKDTSKESMHQWYEALYYLKK